MNSIKGSVIICAVVFVGLYWVWNMSNSSTVDLSQVYRYCAELEEMRKKGEITTTVGVRKEKHAALIEACKKCNVICTSLGPTKTKVSHHGGSYYVDEESVRLNF